MLIVGFIPYISYEKIVDGIGKDDVDSVGIMLDTVKNGFSKTTVVTAELYNPLGSYWEQKSEDDFFCRLYSSSRMSC